jgi:hypothetical protein
MTPPPGEVGRPLNAWVGSAVFILRGIRKGAPMGGGGGRPPALTAEALAPFYEEADLEDTLKTGVASSGDDLGGEMAEVVKDSTSKLTDPDRHAIAAYLRGKDE